MDIHVMRERIGDLRLDRARPARLTGAVPVLYVHGMWGGSWVFDNYLRFTAARGREAWALNLRGHHGSRPVDDLGRVTLEDYIHDVADALDALGPAVVVGHSMGGALAQRWVLAHPERVRALVLSSSFAKVYDPPGNRFARYLEQPFVVVSQRLLPPDPALVLARWLARREAWVYDARCDDRLLRFVRFCMRGARAATLRSALALVWAHDTRATASRIAAPTLIVVGERESVFSRPASEELHRLIPGSSLEVAPGVSHLHPLSYPEWLVDTVTRWLRRRSDS